MVDVVDLSELEEAGAPLSPDEVTAKVREQEARAASAEEGPSEIDILDPQARFLTLKGNGVDVEIVPLQTRQLFRLLRIITHGMGARMGNLDFSGGSDAFVSQLMTMVFMAIPDAEDETLDFLKSMVKPQGLTGESKRTDQLTKQELEINQGLWTRVNEALFNPEPEDLVALVERIIKFESPNIQSLGKQVLALLPAAWRSQISQGMAGQVS